MTRKVQESGVFIALLALFVAVFDLNLICVNAHKDLLRNVKDIFDGKTALPRSQQGFMTYSRYSKHPCNRECKPNDHRVCYYNLMVDYYHTWSKACGDCPRNLADCYREHCAIADSQKTEFLAINYMFPGPRLEACYNDTMVIDVHNRMLEDTTMHWHGVHMVETPYMDGLPYVTQNPIKPGETFRYRYRADRPGTCWYHSHVGLQRAFGLSGALIFRQPKSSDPHSHLYNHDLNEHVVFLNDWATDFITDPIANLLINGKGRHQNGTRPILYSKFNVRPQDKYRFRLIFEGFGNCQLELSIDHHRLLVISSDGNDIEPVWVDSITVLSGERYDFVLKSDAPVDNYWMRVRGMNACNNYFQGAILHYMGADEELPPVPLTGDYQITGVKMNEIDFHDDQDTSSVSIVDTNALYDASWGETPVFETYYLPLTINRGNDSLSFLLDGIKSTMPGVALLPAKDLIDPETYFCDKEKLARSGNDCVAEMCECLHVIKLPLGRHIEFVIANHMGVNHPMHTHGYTFQVVGQGLMTEEELINIEEIDKHTPLPRKLHRAPWKDTVQVYALGYTILRFFTNNPGFWMIHCHVELHAQRGMFAIFQIGEVEDMIPYPNSFTGGFE